MTLPWFNLSHSPVKIGLSEFRRVLVGLAAEADSVKSDGKSVSDFFRNLHRFASVIEAAIGIHRNDDIVTVVLTEVSSFEDKQYVENLNRLLTKIESVKPSIVHRRKEQLVAQASQKLDQFLLKQQIDQEQEQEAKDKLDEIKKMLRRAVSDTAEW